MAKAPIDEETRAKNTAVAEMVSAAFDGQPFVVLHVNTSAEKPVLNFISNVQNEFAQSMIEQAQIKMAAYIEEMEEDLPPPGTRLS